MPDAARPAISRTVIARARAYFRSGWAFFVPYLLAYLLFAALNWPVGPSGGIGCLLHLYYGLHALHLILLSVVLAARATPGKSPDDNRRHWPAILPWALLGLFFLVAGPFLEFPADTWEHLTRTSEWGDQTTVREHGYWLKSGYFLAYSLIGGVPPGEQRLALHCLQAACCLLLAWQYFRLGETAGLRAEWAMMFVFFQVLTSGNGIFSFFRYYGIASTLYAQIAAVAATRISLEAAALGTDWLARARSGAGALACLLLLAGFNHPQAVVIIAVALAGVALWRLKQASRTALTGLVLAIVVLSVAVVLWFPRSDDINALRQPHGWLAPWYGFNVGDVSSPAFGRAVAILGAAGLVNLAVGLGLLLRNHVVGWISLTPIFALGLPATALPFASALVSSHPENILAFHRILFGIPAGLALLTCLQFAAARYTAMPAFLLPALVMIAAALVLVPAPNPYYNRFWNSVAISPRDLTLAAIPVADLEALEHRASSPADFVGPRQLGHAAFAVGVRPVPYDFRARTIFPPHVPSDAVLSLDQVIATAPRSFFLVVPSERMLFSAGSLAAKLSGHWFPYQVALGNVGMPELRDAARRTGAREESLPGINYYRFTPPRPSLVQP